MPNPEDTTRNRIIDALAWHYERREGEFSDDALDMATADLDTYRDECRHEAAEELRTAAARIDRTTMRGECNYQAAIACADMLEV